MSNRKLKWVRFIAFTIFPVLIYPIYIDAVDVKDLQYRIVKSRKQAITLITDIYNAEAKTMIKNIKEIESRPTNTEINYKPLNIEKIRLAQIPMSTKVR